MSNTDQTNKEIDERRELLCERCACEYNIWFAPNTLWNKVMRHPDGREASEKYQFCCPRCFTYTAEALGLCGIWKLDLETSTKPQANTLDEIRKAVRDGLANHTGEWLNGFVTKDNYTVEQSTQLLNNICESKRLNNNIQALIAEAYKEGYIARGIETLTNKEFNDLGGTVNITGFNSVTLHTIEGE